MKTLKTDITVNDICEGFVYNEPEDYPVSKMLDFRYCKFALLNKCCLSGRLGLGASS